MKKYFPKSKLGSDNRPPPVNHLPGVYWGTSDQTKFLEGIQKSIDNVPHVGIYAGDNLFTYGRNLGFLSEARFIEATEKNADTNVEKAILWRSHIVTWAALNGLKLDGDFVECGCYKGTTAKIVCDYVALNETNKSYYLYDLFYHDESMNHHSLQAHSEDLYEQVVQRFRDNINVHIIQGFIPDSFSQGLPEKISFMHIDMNNAKAEVAALEVLWERMVPGAILILDDYGWFAYAEQKYQEDLFFKKEGYQVAELPTGQGMVIKQ